MRLFIVLCFICTYSVTFSQGFSKLYSEVSPSVVTISAKDFSDAEVVGGKNDFGNTYLGSGFLVTPTKIITASHVIDSTDDLYILFTDGEVIRATVNVNFESSDIAIIDLEKRKENAVLAKLGDSNMSKIGDETFLIGAPFGLRSTLSVGHLTGKRKNINYYNPFFSTSYIQIDAVVNSGNSGGPLFDRNGLVIGVISNLATDSGSFQGIGFAIDIGIVKEILLGKEKVWSNAQLYLVSKDNLVGEEMPQEHGLMVMDIKNPSVYDKIGLQKGYTDIVISDIDITIGGDIILAFNNVAIELTETTFAKINLILESYENGGELSLKILRQGKIIELKG